MLKKPVTTIINHALRKARIQQRFIRGRGYYYVTAVAVSSGYYVCWLDQSERELRDCVQHVNEVFVNEGIHIQLCVKRQERR